MDFRKAFWLPLILACGANTGPDTPGVTTTTRATVAPRETVDLTRQHAVAAIDLMAPRSQAWSAMLEAHEALGIPASSIDEKAGTAVFLSRERVGNIAGKAASTYVDCGMGSAGPRANSYRLTIRISETVESMAENHTRVHTVLEAWARSPGISSDPVDCSSTGRLERYIVGMISARVR